MYVLDPIADDAVFIEFSDLQMRVGLEAIVDYKINEKN